MFHDSHPNRRTFSRNMNSQTDKTASAITRNELAVQ
jgi:hypothetical protein